MGLSPEWCGHRTCRWQWARRSRYRSQVQAQRRFTHLSLPPLPPPPLPPPPLPPPPPPPPPPPLVAAAAAALVPAMSRRHRASASSRPLCCRSCATGTGRGRQQSCSGVSLHSPPPPPPSDALALVCRRAAKGEPPLLSRALLELRAHRLHLAFRGRLAALRKSWLAADKEVSPA